MSPSWVSGWSFGSERLAFVFMRILRSLGKGYHPRSSLVVAGQQRGLLELSPALRGDSLALACGGCRGGGTQVTSRSERRPLGCGPCPGRLLGCGEIGFLHRLSGKAVRRPSPGTGLCMTAGHEGPSHPNTLLGLWRELSRRLLEVSKRVL